MNKSLRIFTVLTALASGSLTFAEGNDLFSDIRTNSVFDDGASTTASSPVSSRITSGESLRDLLNSTGFDAKLSDGRIVTLSKKLDPWTFPVLALVSEDEQNVAIMLGLRTISDPTELTSETLLKMMKASQKHAPFVFSYNGDRKRTELYTVVRNQNLSGTELRDTINRMAIVAKENASIWAKADPSEQTASATPTAPGSSSTPETPVAPATPAVDLTGVWSAEKSTKEAFAVQFNANGSFNLVYVNNGNQTKSSGKFTVAANQLTLNGADGMKLAGKLTIKSATEFDFKPENSEELTFRKAGK